jgi:HK97 family phage major capsid protein
MDLFALKRHLAQLTMAHESVNDEYMGALTSATSTQDGLAELKAKRDDLKNRVDEIAGEVGRLEAEANARLDRQERDEPRTESAKAIKATADFIRATVRGQKAELTPEIMNALVAIPSGGGTGGENLLPTQMQNEIVSEPFGRNPLREIISISNIVGLELPKIAFTIADDSFVADSATAKEMAATGTKVTFGRNKSKIFCDVSESVLNGSDLALVEHVRNGLASGLAVKERKVSFATAPNAGEEHMSFYQVDGEGASVITEVAGATMFDAIINAIADLEEDYRDIAKVVMTYADYIAMVRAEAALRGDSALYDAPPEKVIGKPVRFCDSATTPIVGAFGYCRLNYEGEATYESDKNVKTGDTTFVLTATYDQQRLLNSAFRLAVVEASV